MTLRSWPDSVVAKNSEDRLESFTRIVENLRLRAGRVEKIIFVVSVRQDLKCWATSFMELVGYWLPDFQVALFVEALADKPCSDGFRALPYTPEESSEVMLISALSHGIAVNLETTTCVERHRSIAAMLGTAPRLA